MLQLLGFLPEIFLSIVIFLQLIVNLWDLTKNNQRYKAIIDSEVPIQVLLIIILSLVLLSSLRISYVEASSIYGISFGRISLKIFVCMAYFLVIFPIYRAFITEKINIKTKKITLLTALLVGIAQSIAILPGISRSGATICCALLLGASKKEASAFSFLICLPVIFGKSAMDILSLEFTSLINFNPYILISFVVTFVIGCLCCNWMIKIVDNSKLKYFGYYCLIISLLVFSFENF